MNCAWRWTSIGALALFASGSVLVGCSNVPADRTGVEYTADAAADPPLDGIELVVRRGDGSEAGRTIVRPEPARDLGDDERGLVLLPAALDGAEVRVIAFGLRGESRVSRDSRAIQLFVGQPAQVELNLVPRCGDGLVLPGSSEVCDDGDADDDDGCAGDCTLTEGYACTGGDEDPSACAPVCGDALVVGDEACDNGEHCEDGTPCVGDGACAGIGDERCAPRDGDGCPADCQAGLGCGDGTVDEATGEICDEGAGNSDELPNRCRTDCTLPACGDEVRDDAYEESCDEGAANSDAPDATCRPDCTSRRCGDAVRDPGFGEECDFGEQSVEGCIAAACTAQLGWLCSATGCRPTCGDGNVVGYESCDDSNAAAGDGCSAICVAEPGYVCLGAPSTCIAVCGDGLTRGPETCDDGNRQAGDGCDAFCEVEPGHTCAPTVNGSQCRPTCGDGLKLEAEACDDNNALNGDGCNVLCQVEPGWICDGSPSECARCGNGLRELGEQCDDGNSGAGDGCSDTCQTEAGYVCAGQPSNCSLTCGFGTLDAGEQCDDGNLAAGDGCSPICRFEPGFLCSGTPSSCAAVCGDGLTRGAETCDDGDLTFGDGCNSLCQTEPGYDCAGSPSVCSRCGDGLITGDEQCDDGDLVDGDGCTSTCQVQSGWFCVPGSEPSICTFPCGDYYGNLQGGVVNEACDDANLIDGDGCSAACTIEDGFTCDNPDPADMAASDCAPVCGDGQTLQSASIAPDKREHCDDGNLDNGDGCGSDCRIESGWTCEIDDGLAHCTESCGDGVVAGLETCDDGNTAGGDGCSAACVVEVGHACPPSGGACTAVCGDGLVVAGEGCDPGLFTDGDGCDDTCRVEPGFRCSGQPSSCVTAVCGDGFVDVTSDETCDDGDTDAGDGCAADCLIEPGYVCAGEPSVCADCGDGLIEPPEQCDDGNAQDGDGCAASCTIEPLFYCAGEPSVCQTVCGNDRIGDADELCDDGTQCANGTPCTSADVCVGIGDGACRTRSGDGCSATCNIEPGFACSPVPGPGEVLDGFSTCLAVCGDGLVRADEPCDDGDLDDGDGCSSTCEVEPGYTCTTDDPSACTGVCGDGIRTPDEGCDDGNPFGGDGCSSTCEVEPGFDCTGDTPSVCAGLCGDTLVSAGETCDDGRRCDSGASCDDDDDCTGDGSGLCLPRSGDGCSNSCAVEPGWACPFAGQPCQRCGDAVVQGTETCDDGNLETRDGCSDICALEDEYCGDGVPQAPFESCDDGRHCASGAPCVDASDCVGDGDERCETRGGDGCSADCQLPPAVCGDSVTEQAETCDDGNPIAGDGCSDTCQTETDFTCTADEPSVCRCQGPSCPPPSAMVFDPAPVDVGTCAPVVVPMRFDTDYPAVLEDLSCQAAPSWGPLVYDDDQVGLLDVSGNRSVRTWPDVFNTPACLMQSGGLLRVGANNPFSARLPHLDLTGVVDPELSLRVAYRTPLPGEDLTVFAACGADPGPGDVLATYLNALSGGSDDCRVEKTSLDAFAGCTDLRITLGWTPLPGTARLALDDIEITSAATPITVTRPTPTTYEMGAQQCFAGALNVSCTWDDGVHPAVLGAVSVPHVDVTTCGDGAFQAPETCDDGNTDDGDGCSALCQVEDGFTCATPWEPYGCGTVCGDGVVTGYETCDDGNATAGDGCSAGCQEETTYTCTGEPSICTTLCGNGQLDDGEACDDGRHCDDGTPCTGDAECTGGDGRCVPRSGFGNFCSAVCADEVPGASYCNAGETCLPQCDNACTGLETTCHAGSVCAVESDDARGPIDLLCDGATCTDGAENFCKAASQVGLCSATCINGATCTLACEADNGTDCDFTCGAGSTCDLRCENVKPNEGSYCSMQCEAGAYCDLWCDRSNCSVTCEAGAACIVSDCEDLGPENDEDGCVVDCPGSVPTQCANDPWTIACNTPCP